jgi:hypothetical protein
VIEAAKRYLRRKYRFEYPKGHRDGAGRWYPEAGETPRRNFRTPSRKWPWSIFKGCLSVAHCAHLSGLDDDADVTAVRREVRAIKRANPGLFS